VNAKPYSAVFADSILDDVASGEQSQSGAVRAAVIAAAAAVVVALIGAAATYLSSSRKDSAPPPASVLPAATTSVPRTAAPQSDDESTSARPSPSGPRPNGEIASAMSGKCAEILEGKADSGLPVTQYTCNGNANQILIATAGQQPGDYLLAFRHSGKCMAVKDQNVVQEPCENSAPWHFEYRISDTKKKLHYWAIRFNGETGNCLELPTQNDRIDGTPLRIAACTKDNHQQWRTRY
jgi:hypothetical protein